MIGASAEQLAAFEAESRSSLQACMSIFLMHMCICSWQHLAIITGSGCARTTKKAHACCTQPTTAFRLGAQGIGMSVSHAEQSESAQTCHVLSFSQFQGERTAGHNRP